MAFTSLHVAGLRGFSAAAQMSLATPNGTAGSGLTILVGPNNAGKSTVVEALSALSRTQVVVSFNSGMRNKEYGDRVELAIRGENGDGVSVASIEPGTSQTKRVGGIAPGQLLVVPSRRSFQPFFSENHNRSRDYSGAYQWGQQRSSPIPGFEARLFALQEDSGARLKFDAIFNEIVGVETRWTIDQSEQGQYFLKFKRTDFSSHSSDGLGEGLISLLFIADALYDSTSESLIVFDEPELSLHPQFQRRLRAVLARYAADRQILYATHSPYFVNWSDVAAGASIARVVAKASGSVIHEASRNTLQLLSRSAADRNNPHSLGLNASEVFFLEDRVLLTEGQEDVVLLPLALAQLGIPIGGDFYGWGVGGAEKMKVVMRLLRELGYERVAGILDNDKEQLASELRGEFKGYHIAVIPAADVRDKKARPAVDAKRGLVDSTYVVHEELVEPAREVFESLNVYLSATAQ